MIDILVILLIVLVFAKSRFAETGQFHEDYFSLKNLNAVKGALAVIVMLHHLSQRTEAGLLIREFTNFGYLPVAAFFLFSGYGLMLSHQKKENYKLQFLLKRIPTILFQYAAVVAVYWFAVGEIEGVRHSWGYIWRGFKQGDPIAMFSWYVCVILMFYVGFLLLMLIFRKNYKGIIAGSFAMCIIWMVCSWKLGYGTYWCNTTAAFPLGMLWAYAEKNGVPYIRGKYAKLCFFAVILFPLVYCVNKHSWWYPYPVQVLITWIISGLFGLMLILLLMKVKIGNPVLDFLGKISFEVYMIHGIFIQWFRSYHINIGSDSLWAAAVIGAAIVGAFVLHMVFSFISKCYGKLIDKLLRLPAKTKV